MKFKNLLKMFLMLLFFGTSQQEFKLMKMLCLFCHYFRRGTRGCSALWLNLCYYFSEAILIDLPAELVES